MDDESKNPGQDENQTDQEVTEDGGQKPKKGRRRFLVGTLIAAPAVATLGSSQSFGFGSTKGKKDKKDKKKGSVSMSQLASVGKGKKKKVKMKM